MPTPCAKSKKKKSNNKKPKAIKTIPILTRTLPENNPLNIPGRSSESFSKKLGFDLLPKGLGKPSPLDSEDSEESPELSLSELPS